MLIVYCFIHCVVAYTQFGGEFIGSSLSIFIMLSASSENSAKGVSLQQILALCGYTLFITTKLIKFVESLQQIALAIYFITVLAAAILWFLFSPSKLLKGLPNKICHFQGKYYLSRTNIGKQKFAGNLNSIRLTFKEYL